MGLCRPGATADGRAGRCGTELAEPAASLPLSRGVVTAPPTELQVDGIGVSFEGSIDLYLWAADLTLRTNAGGPDLRVIGPLDRPQVRLNQAAGPGADAPALSDP